MITIKAGDLVNALKPIVRVVRGKSTFPILSHVYICVENEIMTLIGTDTETEIINKVRVLGENTEFTVPALVLNDLCKSWKPGQDVTIDFKGDKALLRCGRSRANLEVLSVDDFPLNEKVEFQTISIDSKKFAQSLSKARLAINKNHTNLSLKSVSMVFAKNKLIIAGFCNEHVISETITIDSEIEGEVLISDATTDVFLFCISECDFIEIGVFKGKVIIKSGDFICTARTVVAKVCALPDRIIDMTGRVSFVINKEELLSVINRALIFCRNNTIIKSGYIKGFNKKVEVRAVNDRNMEFLEEIDSDIKEEFEICFNLALFEKIYNVSPEDCELFLFPEVCGLGWNINGEIGLIAGINI